MVLVVLYMAFNGERIVFHLILLKTFAYFPKKLYLCTRNVSHISANNRSEQQ